MADLVSEGVEATVPPTVRETVEKLARLYSDDEEAVTITGSLRSWSSISRRRGAG